MSLRRQRFIHDVLSGPRSLCFVEALADLDFGRLRVFTGDLTASASLLSASLLLLPERLPPPRPEPAAAFGEEFFLLSRAKFFLPILSLRPCV